MRRRVVATPEPATARRLAHPGLRRPKDPREISTVVPKTRGAIAPPPLASYLIFRTAERRLKLTTDRYYLSAGISGDEGNRESEATGFSGGRGPQERTATRNHVMKFRPLTAARFRARGAIDILFPAGQARHEVSDALGFARGEIVLLADIPGEIE